MKILAILLMLMLGVHALLRAEDEVGEAGEGHLDTGGYRRARELLEEGIVFEAIHELERFVAGNPDHEAARMLLARSLHRVERSMQAAQELSQVVRINPGNMEARRMLARLRVDIGKQLDRKDPVAVLAYARLCAQPGSYDRAAEHYRLALTLDDDISLHREFGRMLYWAGVHEEAALHYEAYLASTPGHPEALVEAGRIYNALGRFDLALDAFEQSQRKQALDTEARLDMARALIWSGQESEAETRLSEMHRKQEGGDTPLMLLASIATRRGDVLDAFSMYEQVLRRNPEHREARQRLMALQQDHVLEEARLEAGLARDPEHHETRHQLVDLYVSMSRYGEALQQLEQLNRLLPDDPAVRAKLHEVREAEGRQVLKRVEAFLRRRSQERQREITLLREWIEDNPNDMRSRALLTGLLIDGGFFDEAAVHLAWLQAATPEGSLMTETLDRRLQLGKQVPALDQTVDEATVNRELP